MRHKYNTQKTLTRSFELMIKRPIILLPFIILAFLEGLALELIYFSPRRPISLAVNPIVRKFFGEQFIHYPANLFLLPKLFFYTQIVIYVVAGVFLVAISINIFANLRADRPLNIKALLKNATRIYPALFAYGALVSIYILLAQKADNFIIGETFKFAIQHIPNTAPRIYAFITPLFFFITNVILQVFIILALPLIVLQKRSSIKALANSFYLGARHFSKLFVLIFIPFLLYLPIYLLESYSAKLAEISLPEINLYIMGFGIAVTMFVNYLITMCAVQFLLEITPAEIKK